MDVMQAIHARHSIRVFTAEPVSPRRHRRAHRRRRRRALRVNSQPWRFHVATGERRRSVDEVMAQSTVHLDGVHRGARPGPAASRPRSSTPNLGDAPVVIAVVAARRRRRARPAERVHLGRARRSRTSCSRRPTWASAAATSPFSFWVRDELIEAFEVPEDREIVSLILVGHPGETPRRAGASGRRRHASSSDVDARLRGRLLRRRQHAALPASVRGRGLPRGARRGRAHPRPLRHRAAHAARRRVLRGPLPRRRHLLDERGGDVVGLGRHVLAAVPPARHHRGRRGDRAARLRRVRRRRALARVRRRRAGVRAAARRAGCASASSRTGTAACRGSSTGSGSTPLIDTVVSSAEVGLHKPDPRIFELACRRLGVAPDEARARGRPLLRGRLGAQVAGLHAGADRPARACACRRASRRSARSTTSRRRSEAECVRPLGGVSGARARHRRRRSRSASPRLVLAALLVEPGRRLPQPVPRRRRCRAARAVHAARRAASCSSSSTACARDVVAQDDARSRRCGSTASDLTLTAAQPSLSYPGLDDDPLGRAAADQRRDDELVRRARAGRDAARHGASRRARGPSSSGRRRSTRSTAPKRADGALLPRTTRTERVPLDRPRAPRRSSSSKRDEARVRAAAPARHRRGGTRVRRRVEGVPRRRR